MASTDLPVVTGLLTDLPVVREADASITLQDFRRYGVELSAPGMAECVHGTFKVVLGHLVTMQAIGQIDEATAQTVLNLIVGLDQSVDEARYMVRYTAAEDKAARDRAAAARPPKKSIWKRLLWI